MVRATVSNFIESGNNRLVVSRSFDPKQSHFMGLLIFWAAPFPATPMNFRQISAKVD